MWEIVVIVLVASRPVFTSKDHVYPTQELCQKHIIKATEEFIAQAANRGVANYSFEVKCKPVGEPT